MRVVEHVAEPVAQPRLLLGRRLDRRTGCSAIAFAVRTRSCCPVRAMLTSPDAGVRRTGPEWPGDPPSPGKRASLARSGHADHPLGRIRLARRAAALAFATQGLVFISLTTRLPRFSDRWDLSEVELSLRAADDRAARRCRLGGRRAGRAPQLTARAPCAPGCSSSAVAVPVVAAAPSGLVFVARARGVRRGAGHRRRDQQHAGGRGRAPLRPPDPAVVPRRVDLRRHRRRVLRAGRRAPAARGRPAWSRWCRCWRSPRRTCPASTARPSPAAEEVAVPWRPILLVGLGMVLFYMVDTAAQTWGPTYLDDVVDAPHSLVALATLPYLVASLALRLAGDSAGGGYGAGAGAAHRRRGGLAGAARGGHRADLAGGGARLHPARRRRLGDRAAELLGGGPDRRWRRRPASTR